MGPVILLLALLLAGGYFLASHVPHPARQAATHAAPPAEASKGRAITIPSGVKLPGRVIGTPHIRSDPSSNASIYQDLQSGQSVTVGACSSGCGWYLVTAPELANPGWVPSGFVDVKGDDRKLPAIH